MEREIPSAHRPCQRVTRERVCSLMTSRRAGPTSGLPTTGLVVRATMLLSACVLSCLLCLTLCNPVDWSLPGSSVHGILQARILEWVVIPSSRGSPRPGDGKPSLLSLLHWQVGSLPLASPGKPNNALESESGSVVSDALQPHGLYSSWDSPGQNTGVGSCSLLQGIFPTQGLNPGLPHCRQILYQLSYQGSPKIGLWDLSSLTRGWTWAPCSGSTAL